MFRKPLGYLLSLAISLVSSQAAALDGCGPANWSPLKRTVYVKPNGTDAGACGTTPDQACKTLQRGIERCAGLDCGVLVQQGKYELTATVELASGVHVYGSCEFKADGTTSKSLYRSILLAPPNGNPAIRATKITDATRLSGLNVLGSDATTPGAPSIGMIIKDSPAAKLFLQDNLIVGGKGADGATGQTFERPPVAGSGGSGDSRKCPYSQRVSCQVGGRGGQSGSGVGGGGHGGSMSMGWDNAWDTTCRWDSRPGHASGTAGVGPASGKGGNHGAPGAKCLGHFKPGDGENGGDATASGDCAQQGGRVSPDQRGTFNPTSGTWQPSAGGSGGTGVQGASGGGGGAGGSCITNETLWMAGGGGGGAGGDGGRGGQGGQQGGASLALVLIHSTVAGQANAIIPGSGGKGGLGGTGGLGGWGGGGGKGNRGRFDTVDTHECPGKGGDGGGGSQGGAGAGGAGGNGGPSIGIALVDVQDEPLTLAKVYDARPGVGGQGGQGGSEGCTAAHGEEGAVGAAERLAHVPLQAR